ncbi:MAG: MATE family efflux transporter [bacterium]
MDRKTEIFEKMPVWKAIATLAIPAILSQLVTMIYNLADTFYIGQTNDPNQVAAVTLSFGAFMILAAIANLFGIGGGSLMARMLGQKRPQDAKRVAAFSFFGAGITALIYGVFVWIFLNPILSLLGASTDTIGFARDYLFFTTVAGGLPTALGITLGHLLRSEGGSRQASIGIAIGGVLNIILDPIFIFTLDLGVAGAAIATMISNCVALLYYFLLIFAMKEKTYLSLQPKEALIDKKLIRQILSVGIPAATAVILMILTNASLIKLLSAYGDVPIAAMGIVKKIDGIPFSIAMGLAQGVLPLVAYNYAAKDFHRMHAASRFARFAGVGFAILCVITFELFAPQLVLFFIGDPATVELGSGFLRVACLATPAMALFFLYNATFQAMGKGKQSFLLVVLRQLVINLPILFALNAIFGMPGLVWTQLIADTLAVLMAAFLFAATAKQLRAEKVKFETRSV